MRALVFLIPFLIIQSLSVADDSAARIIEGSCGDHWFKIHFKANEQTKAVTLSFSGDSGENAEFTGTLIKEKNDPSFQIKFNSPQPGYLNIDGTDYYHNIYWGTLSRTGRPEDSQGMGLCSIM
ncbi:MAG: hypothetical protein ACKOA8_05670 [Deltaproteobacteria bacterium]